MVVFKQFKNSSAIEQVESCDVTGVTKMILVKDIPAHSRGVELGDL